MADWRKRIEAGPGMFTSGWPGPARRIPNPNRSCPPEYLAPLFAVNGIRFYSLQIGERDRLPLPPELAENVIDLIGISSVRAAGTVLGGCIGSSYCLGLIKLAPERVSAAALQNPIGLSPENRTAFYEMFDGSAADSSAPGLT